MKRKSKEVYEAEQIVAALLRKNTPTETLNKAKRWRQSKEYAIAQRVTVAIMLCTLWDFYEDFNEEMLKDIYQQYLAYYKSFDEDKEDIFKQMNAINDLLSGDLLDGKLFDAVRMEEGDDSAYRN